MSFPVEGGQGLVVELLGPASLSEASLSSSVGAHPASARPSRPPPFSRPPERDRADGRAPCLDRPGEGPTIGRRLRAADHAVKSLAVDPVESVWLRRCSGRPSARASPTAAASPRHRADSPNAGPDERHDGGERDPGHEPLAARRAYRQSGAGLALYRPQGLPGPGRGYSDDLRASYQVGRRRADLRPGGTDHVPPPGSMDHPPRAGPGRGSDAGSVARRSPRTPRPTRRPGQTRHRPGRRRSHRSPKCQTEPGRGLTPTVRLQVRTSWPEASWPSSAWGATSRGS